LFQENLELNRRIVALEDEISSLNEISVTLRQQLIDLGEEPKA